MTTPLTRSALLATVPLVMIAGAVAPVRAQGLPSQLEIHGFGNWAYRRTNTNDYLGGVPDGTYRSVEFALNIAAAVQSSLTIDGQVHFTESVEDELVDVGYAFAEWRFSDALRLRAGKMQLPFGIYTEVFRVGPVRPFASLPQAIYGPAGFISEASEGVGIRGAIPAGGHWELHYDVYGGGTDVPEQNFTINLAQGLPPEEEESAGEGELTRDLIGARLNVRTPIPGLRFGASAYTGTNVADDGSERKTVAGAHAEFLTDRWWLRSEYVHEREGEHRVNAGYLEAARFLSDKWQVAVLYDRLQVSLLDDPDPANPSFLRHREFAFGLNYWFTPEFVLKGSYAFVSGNRFAAVPVEDPAEIDPKTRLLQVAAEFSF